MSESPARLQKVLAQAGFGARRKCEALIAAGRVTINGHVAALGERVRPGDAVAVDGAPVAQAEDKVYIALHKPVGFASDRSSPRNKTLFELVDVPQRLFGVGRLDKDSSGLILLTNDGEFAYRLTHPRFEHEKEYRVGVRGRPDSRTLQRWRDGVLLDGEVTKTAPCRIDVLGAAGDSTTTLRVVMREGRKRQIRRVAKLLGHPVIELVRVRVGAVKLGALESGAWRHLSDREVRALMAAPRPDERNGRPTPPHAQRNSARG